MLRVLVTRQLPEKFISSLRTQLSAKSSVEIVCWHSESEPASKDFLLQQARTGIDGVLCLLTDKIDAQFLQECNSRLRCVSTMSVGVDHIDVAECRQRSIRIGYTPGVLTNATADLTMALLLATARRLQEALQSVRAGTWGPWAPYELCGTGLYDSTIGIVGLGRIGQAVARRLSGFAPRRLLYSGRRPKPEADSLNCHFVPFEQLLAESDFVLACCPANQDTAGMFNANVFGQMKRTGVFVNIARGSIVNHRDLHAALESRTIAAAGLDVTDPEPLPTDSPLLQLSNCVVLPHIGSADFATRNSMAQMAVDNLAAALTGVAQMPAEFE